MVEAVLVIETVQKRLTLGFNHGEAQLFRAEENHHHVLQVKGHTKSSVCLFWDCCQVLSVLGGGSSFAVGTAELFELELGVALGSQTG